MCPSTGRPVNSRMAIGPGKDKRSVDPLVNAGAIAAVWGVIVVILMT